MKRVLTIATVVVLILLAAVGTWIALAWRADPAPRITGVQVEPTTLRVTEVAHVSVSIALPWHARPLEAALPMGKSEGWQVRATHATRGMPGTREWHWTVVIELQAAMPDAPAPPQLVQPIDSERKGMDPLLVDLSDTTFTVATTLTDLDEQQPIAAGLVPYVAPIDSHGDVGKMVPWLLGTLGVIVVVMVVVMYLRRSRRPPPPRHAWEVAADDLTALEGRLPMADEPFFVALNDLLRSYLERRFQLPATTQTTPEFLRTLHRDSSPLNTTQVRHLQAILAAADAVKFARETRDEQALRDAVTAARTLVTETVPRDADQPSGESR